MNKNGKSNSTSQFYHRKLPPNPDILCGHTPQNNFGFQTENIQIYYNATDESWVGDGEVQHRHLHSDECFVLLKGRIIVEVEENIHEINEGEFCVFPKGVFHAIKKVYPPIEILAIRGPSVNDKEYKSEKMDTQ